MISLETKLSYPLSHDSHMGLFVLGQPTCHLNETGSPASLSTGNMPELASDTGETRSHSSSSLSSSLVLTPPVLCGSSWLLGSGVRWVHRRKHKRKVTLLPKALCRARMMQKRRSSCRPAFCCHRLLWSWPSRIRFKGLPLYKASGSVLAAVAPQ